jgi:hypothetical protein
MKIRAKKIPSALKYGAYTSIDVLPGEDPAKFAKLHRELIVEFAPDGATEDDIVASIARLIWRKQNLATLRMPKHAEEPSKEACAERYRKSLELNPPPGGYKRREFKTENDPEDAAKAARQRDFEELIAAQKSYMRLLNAPSDVDGNGEAAIFERLNKDLDIEDRFGIMIDKCLKRLLFLRGLKSISASVSSATSAPPKKLAAGLSRAA